MRIHQAPMNHDPDHPLAAFMAQLNRPEPMAWDGVAFRPMAVAHVNDIPLSREQAERAAALELAVAALPEGSDHVWIEAAAFIATGAVPE